jgi:hypothetical protein
MIKLAPQYYSFVTDYSKQKARYNRAFCFKRPGTVYKYWAIHKLNLNNAPLNENFFRERRLSYSHIDKRGLTHALLV